LIFLGGRVILNPMKRLKHALIQAVVLCLLGFVVAFAHNAFSVNGINPFNRVDEVPVIDGTQGGDRDGIRLVALEDVERLVQHGRVVIDARTADEYDEGHIPGAVLVDYFEMGRYLEKVLPLLSPDEEIVVYCSGEGCEDAELLARELYTLGFERVLVFKGGLEGWVNAGLPIEGGLD
jgi:rhodanese-related sulfurtransferase